jgi:protein involved in polysaccharide export with SLBB domain
MRKFFLVISLLSVNLYSQVDNSLLSEEFLEGLPPSIRDEIDIKNQVNEEREIEELFRSETSLEKNKIILNKLNDQLNALKKRFDEDITEDDNSLERFGSSFFKSIQSSFMPINIPNLSGEYILDVGDKLNLILSGEVKSMEGLEILRDGSILIPKYGKVSLAGLSLDQAEKSISAFFQTKAPSVEPTIQLSKLRDVQILILGNIISPGIYTLSAGSNILSALNVAGGIDDKGSYRRIEHKRNGSILKIVDLYNILINGNFDYSTQFRSGDVILVKSSYKNIPVSGAVANEAIFEILPDETLMDAINYAGGFTEDYLGYGSLLVKRSDLRGSKYVNFKDNSYEDVILKPRDSVLVPSFKNEIDSARVVHISGRVKNPGSYFITEGETLSNLIARAGGYANDAYIYGAALFREDALEKQTQYAQLNYSDTVNFIISNIGRPGTSVNSSALDLLAEELRSQTPNGRILAEFDIDRLSDGQDDIRLMHNDRIVVPPMQKVIYTFGDFRNPSNSKYDPKLKVSDYIKLAGGLKESSFNEIVVIDPDGKTSIYNSKFSLFEKDITLYPGSIIYAPRDIGRLSGVQYASTIAPIVSSLAISLASLNSINN